MEVGTRKLDRYALKIHPPRQDQFLFNGGMPKALAAIEAAFRDTPAHVKHIARLTGANARTVQNWLQARNGPSGAGLVVLMRHSDEVTTAVLTLSERDMLLRSSASHNALISLRESILAALQHLPDE